jgi:diacylglycerol kinase family enzyme
MKHVFVFDSKAFYNQQWKMDSIQDNIGQFFRTHENPDFSILHTRYRRSIMFLLGQEVEKAEPDDKIRVYAIGGEEVLYDCLNAVAHFANMQLAIIPYGQKCDFLKIFGNENEYIESFRDIPTITQAHTLPTDIIKWGVNYALNSCYIGMNAAVSKKFKDMRSNLNKGSFLVLFKLSSFLNYIMTSFNKKQAGRKYKITVDDVDYSGNYSLIHVANGPYHNGNKTGSSEAVPNDGLLDIALIKASHPLGTMLSMGVYSSGKRPGNCVYVRGKEITVRSDSHMWIQMDNEYFQDTSVTMSLVPNAVQMVAVNKLSYPVATSTSKSSKKAK